MTVDLKTYLPESYQDIQEFSVIMNAESLEFDEMYAVAEQIFSNQFVLTSDDKGLRYYEQILKISADPTNETIEFRRQRVLNRLALILPFTLPYLRNKLNSMFGEGNWKAWIVPSLYQLFIEMPASSEYWYYELKRLVTAIKPCNIEYISKFLIIPKCDVPKVAPIIQIGKSIMAEPYFESEKETSINSRYLSTICHRICIIQAEPQEV